MERSQLRALYERRRYAIMGRQIVSQRMEPYLELGGGDQPAEVAHCFWHSMDAGLPEPGFAPLVALPGDCVDGLRSAVGIGGLQAALGITHFVYCTHARAAVVLS